MCILNANGLLVNLFLTNVAKIKYFAFISVWFTIQPMNKLLFKKAVKFYGSQSKLAERLNVSKQFISMVKVGVKKMPSDKIDLIKNDLEWASRK